MSEKSRAPRLQNMIDAIEHINTKMEGVTLEAFRGDLDRRRIVERNVEIISEASRHLPDDLKDRHTEVPWRRVAGIGNIIRHDYEDVVPDTLWRLSHDDLPTLERVCKAKLMREKLRQDQPSTDYPQGRSR
jgi:uncharacterized protein with HEPN domain